MQNRLRIAIVVAVAFGLIAAYGIYNFLQRQQEAMEKLRGTTQEVVVADEEIPAGTTLSRNLLDMKPYLKSSLPPGAFTSPAQLEGRVLKVSAVAGEPILANRLGEAAGLTVRLKPGHRAMAVKVNEVVGVSGFISPNDRVDVIATIESPDEDDARVSKVVLQNQRVLSVAQTLEERKDGTAKVASSITLELTPEDAEKLSVAAQEGSIVLALRGRDDEEVVATRGSRPGDLLGNPRSRNAPHSASYRVVLYEGSQRSELKF